MSQPDIFSRTTRRRFRDRAFASDHDARWLTRFVADELVDRLRITNRQFERVLIIGNDGGDLQQQIGASESVVFVADPGFRGAATARGVQCDEDRLPFADASFDLVIASSGLDTGFF
jgi:NADH dehydrogenase [ubiquinone] 1 alpha subcomplex assembly factor 5